MTDTKTSFRDFDPLSPRDAWRFNGHPFRWVWAITRPTRPQLFLGLLGSLLNSALNLVPGLITGKLIDEVFVNGDFTHFWLYVGLIFFIPVLQGLIIFGKRMCFEYVSQHALIRVRDAFYQHLQKLDQDYYSKTPTGRIMARLTGDLEMVRYYLAYAGFMSLQSIVTLFVGLIYLSFVEWRLTLASFIVAPLLLIVAYRLLKSVKPVWRNIRRQFERLNSVVQQNINANRIVRAFTNEEYEVAKFEKENQRFSELHINGANVRARYIPLMNALATFMNIPVILVGGYLAINNLLSVGEVVTFNNLLFMIVNPLFMLGFLIDDLQHYASSADKIIEIFMRKTSIASPADADITKEPHQYDRDLIKASIDSPGFDINFDEQMAIINIKDPKASEEDKTMSRTKLTGDKEVYSIISEDRDIRGYIPDKPFPMREYTTKANMATAEKSVDTLVTEYLENNMVQTIDLKGDVIFEDVSFSYNMNARDIKALEDINFHAKPGQTIGIIGPTGSGKSTLVELISRLADPKEGRILIDGRDLRTYPLNAVRRSIGVVTQEVFLFSDTIESNIAFGDPLMPFEEVSRAARIACAEDFILHETDNGYDTIVGEEGVGLSGGQRQRISLARAIASNPDILILDDTTSAVDMNTDAQIRKNLQETMSDKTIFMIAQRISSIRNSDQIFVMNEGRIAERGTHDELLALDGIYADIYRTQVGDSKEALDIVLNKDRREGEK